MKKLRIALLASCAIFGVALAFNQRASLIREASAQMVQFGGDRMIPLGFCAFNLTTTAATILNGSAGCITGSFGTGVSGTGASTIPTLAKYAQICLNSGSAYYRDDGVNAAVGGTGGMPIGVNSAPPCLFYAGNLSGMSLIASGTVTLSVLLYGQP
jgi:hypothetical protein